MKRNTTLKTAIKRVVQAAIINNEAEFKLHDHHFQLLFKQAGEKKVYLSDFADYLRGVRIAFDATFDEAELATIDAIRELVTERQREEQSDE